MKFFGDKCFKFDDYQVYCAIVIAMTIISHVNNVNNRFINH
jgi:hypothetical protein